MASRERSRSIWPKSPKRHAATTSIALLSRVTEERGWAAKLRIAAVMGKQGKLDDARRYLASLSPDGRDEEVQLSRRRRSSCRTRAIIRAPTPC